MAYLGGHGAMAPSFGQTMKIFLLATLYEKVRFLPFSSKFQKNMGEFAASIERSKAKMSQLQGCFAPLTLDQGLCPWTPLGALPPDPH